MKNKLSNLLESALCISIEHPLVFTDGEETI